MRSAPILVLVFTLVSSLALVSGQDVPVRGAVSLKVEADARDLAALDVDVLVVPVFEGEDPTAVVLSQVRPALAAGLRAALAQSALDGRFGTASFWAPDGLAAKRLLVINAGPSSEFDAERLRRVAGAAVRACVRQQVATIAIWSRGQLPAPDAAAALAEGILLAAFDPGLHKTLARPTSLTRALLAGLGPATPALSAAIERGTHCAQAQNFARSLIVEPSNFMTPELLAQHARQIARDTGLQVEILDETQMETLGMGAIIAVGKGASFAPRFIALRYRAPRPSPITLALAGKGVTFDAGGLSLKDAENMYRQKGDMAGGAAVLGAMQIVARVKPLVNVIGVVPAVMNLPSGTAQRPGDVFTGLSGRTVEVISADAEGRLILSDALTWAVRQGATHLVDVATLTGTVVRALGDRHTGAFASDDRFFDALVAATRRSGESVWRLPLDEEYAMGLRNSLVADLNETGGIAGASVGAKFIQQFTEGRPWIHLDIAGTSWPASRPPHMADGPTGVMVRTLAELALVIDRATSDGPRPTDPSKPSGDSRRR